MSLLFKSLVYLNGSSQLRRKDLFHVFILLKGDMWRYFYLILSTIPVPEENLHDTAATTTDYYPGLYGQLMPIDILSENSVLKRSVKRKYEGFKCTVSPPIKQCTR